MTQAKHTALPWGYDGDGFDSVAAQDFNTEGYTVFPVDAEGDCDGGSICEISNIGDDDEAEANAAFIVRAVNNHESLLDALKTVVAIADRKTVEFDKARAAIAKATEGR